MLHTFVEIRILLGLTTERYGTQSSKIFWARRTVSVQQFRANVEQDGDVLSLVSSHGIQVNGKFHVATTGKNLRFGEQNRQYIQEIGVRLYCGAFTEGQDKSTHTFVVKANACGEDAACRVLHQHMKGYVYLEGDALSKDGQFFCDDTAFVRYNRQEELITIKTEALTVKAWPNRARAFYDAALTPHLDVDIYATQDLPRTRTVGVLGATLRYPAREKDIKGQKHANGMLWPSYLLGDYTSYKENDGDIVGFNVVNQAYFMLY